MANKNFKNFKIKNNILVKYVGKDKNVVIPKEVTEIGTYAFKDCNKVSSITIHELVNKIGAYAFSGCSNLCNINIPDSVVTIEDYVFRGCSHLKTITIPESVISIGKSSFRDCSNLEKIIIPDKVTNIGEWAFAGCSGISSITVGSGISHIDINSIFGFSASSDCSNLESIEVSENNTNYSSVDGILYDKDKKNIVYVPKGIKGVISIADGIISIGKSAFFDCSGIDNIIIPNSVTSIGENAFKGCGNLENIIIPDSVTDLGELVFSECIKLTKISIGSGVTSIGKNAFKGCGNLENIIIPDSVTDLGELAFSECFKLTKISIGSGVTNINIKGLLGFEDSTDSKNYNLKIIEVSENNQNYSSVDGILYDKDKKNIVYVSKRIEGEISIPEGVVSIGESAFFDCNIESVTIPNSVTSIGKRAFCKCVYLQNVELGQGVLSIGELAFDNCRNLRNIIIPNSVISIGTGAFSCCNFSSINIPDSVTEIGEQAFSLCSSVKSITIGSGINHIDINSLFGFDESTDNKNYNLESIEVGENNPNYSSVDGILYDKEGKNIVYVPKRIEGDVIIPDSVTAIGEYTFSNCNNLKCITIGNGVVVCEDNAISNCNRLSTINIGKSVSTFNFDCFFSFYNLENINVDKENTDYFSEDGVLYDKNIKELLFVPKGKKGIVTIPNGIKSIGSYAFSDCDKLSRVTIPDSVTKIADNAFLNCENIEQYRKIESTGVEYDCKKFRITEGVLQKYTGCDREVIIPEGVTKIDKNAFKGCLTITNLILPKQGCTIDKTAFEEISHELKNLQTFDIPEGITTIGDLAFSGFENLRSVSIPSTVKEIGEGVFANCKKLESMIISEDNKNFYMKEGVLYNKNNEEVYYPENKKKECEFDTSLLTNSPIILEKGTDGSFGKNGSYVLFGDWPQTIKSDDVIIDEKNKYNINGWESYKGSDGCYYVKEVANPYDDYSFSNGSEIKKGYTYYFKIESIKWCIIDNDYNEGSLLVSEKILTTDFYDSHISEDGDPIEREAMWNKVQPNNYEYSRIRAYLNGLDGTRYDVADFNGRGFINRAFSASAMENIEKVTVDNGESSTTDRGHNLNTADKYICNDTEDKIFLLSESEVTTKEYVFDPFDKFIGDDKGTKTSSRIRKVTDYSKAVGAFAGISEDLENNGRWWLRSPSYLNQFDARFVDELGESCSNFICYEGCGIVPALVVLNKIKD